MAIDLATQRNLTISEAAGYFPSARQGKPCHTSRVIRAIVDGTPTPTGGREWLEALRIGCKWITTIEAIEDYGRRLAVANVRGAPRSQAKRTRSADRAARELDRIGI